MRSLRWTYVVAAVAAFCLGPSAASAQYGYYGSGPGMPNAGMGMPGYPSAAGVPAYAVAPVAPAIGAAATASPAPPSYGACGCDTGSGCGSGCGLGLGCGGDPAWRAWGDFLYLRARNDGVEYAVPLDPTNSVQVGPTAVMNPQFSSGFRVGIDRAVDDCSEFAVSYTYYRDENTDGTAPPTPFSLESIVFQPNFFAGWNGASAHEITKFQYVDLDYRHNLWGCDCSCLNYFVGARYAELAQQFDATFSDGGVATVATNVNFDGVGLRLGMDGERAFRGGFYSTAKVDANFIGGEFRGSYLNVNPFSVSNAFTTWNQASFMTILEAEVAVGWQSSGGRFRASVGYLLTDWCNAIKTSDYINAVQQNSYHGANLMGTSALIFDGLTGHVELTW